MQVICSTLCAYNFLFAFFFISFFCAHTHIRRRSDRPLSPLNPAGREIVRRVSQIVHPAAEKLQTGRVVSHPRELWRALCVIVRREMLPTWPTWQLSILHARRGGSPLEFSKEQVLRKATSRARRTSVSCSRICRLVYVQHTYVRINAALAAVHIHYPIIVAMTKVSRANKARAAARRCAFASSIRTRVSSANIITPATP